MQKMKINNTALVTGASSGIGRAISRELVKRGWLVIGIARSSDKLMQIQSELSDSFIPMVCDVSKKEDIEGISSQILEKKTLPISFFSECRHCWRSGYRKP